MSAFKMTTVSRQVQVKMTGKGSISAIELAATYLIAAAKAETAEPTYLGEIARIAKEKDTGARGLRSVVEESMFEVMYDLPDQAPGKKYILTPEVIRGEASLRPLDDSASAA